MEQGKSHASDEDIERILRVKDADFGLFVLAMHSLMERALKEKYNCVEDYNSKDYFGKLINQYLEDFSFKYGTPEDGNAG